MENGVEYELFSANKQAPDRSILQGREGIVLGFIGGIKPKLDFKMIKEAALQKPDWTFLWVGPDATNGDVSFQELLRLPNVIWTGPADPKKCLIIWSLSTLALCHINNHRIIKLCFR